MRFEFQFRKKAVLETQDIALLLLSLFLHIVVAVFDNRSSDCHSPKFIIKGFPFFGLMRKYSMRTEPLSFRTLLPFPFKKGAHFFHSGDISLFQILDASGLASLFPLLLLVLFSLLLCPYLGSFITFIFQATLSTKV